MRGLLSCIVAGILAEQVQVASKGHTYISKEGRRPIADASAKIQGAHANHARLAPDANPRTSAARAKEEECPDSWSSNELIVLIGSVLGSSFFFSFVAAKVAFKFKPSGPRYWKNNFWERLTTNPFSKHYYMEIDVTAEYGDLVQKIFDEIVDPDKLGKGREGSWQAHRRLTVEKVTRIENGKVWTDYFRGRNSVPSSSKELNKASPDVATRLSWHHQYVKDLYKTFAEGVLKHKKGKQFLKELDLDHDKGEVMLFHGSPTVGALDPNTGVTWCLDADMAPHTIIKREGFDERVSETLGMFGSGIYMAANPGKADQYAGRFHALPRTSVGEVAEMFMARVTLGLPYVTKTTLEGLRRPPCIEGHFDPKLYFTEIRGTPWKEKKGLQFRCCHHKRCNCVLSADIIDGDEKLYREVVVYSGVQAYPEFSVRYRRDAAISPTTPTGDPRGKDDTSVTA